MGGTKDRSTPVKRRNSLARTALATKSSIGRMLGLSIIEGIIQNLLVVTSQGIETLSSSNVDVERHGLVALVAINEVSK
jgi:hypothetical protein